MNWQKESPNALPIRSWCADVEEGALKQAENLSRKTVAHRVMNAVRKYVKTGAPVGAHLSDQLAVPIVAFAGEARYVKGKDTPHETTNWNTVRAFVPGLQLDRTDLGDGRIAVSVLARPASSSRQ